jgi:hypothetical protein
MLPVEGGVSEHKGVPSMDCDSISFLTLFSVWLSAKSAWLWTNASAVVRISALKKYLSFCLQ